MMGIDEISYEEAKQLVEKWKGNESKLNLIINDKEDQEEFYVATVNDTIWIKNSNTVGYCIEFKKDSDFKYKLRRYENNTILEMCSKINKYQLINNK